MFIIYYLVYSTTKLYSFIYFYFFLNYKLNIYIKKKEECLKKKENNKH